jgi:sugar phosphate isomerase/epimerase
VGAAIAEPDRLDQALDPLGVRLAARDRERQDEVLLGGEDRQQVEELEDEAELVAAQLGQRRVVIRVDLPEPDGPMIAVKRPRSNPVEMSTSASTAASPSP